MTASSWTGWYSDGAGTALTDTYMGTTLTASSLQFQFVTDVDNSSGNDGWIPAATVTDGHLS